MGGLGHMGVERDKGVRVDVWMDGEWEGVVDELVWGGRD